MASDLSQGLYVQAYSKKLVFHSDLQMHDPGNCGLLDIIGLLHQWDGRGHVLISRVMRQRYCNLNCKASRWSPGRIVSFSFPNSSRKVQTKVAYFCFIP